MVYCGKPSNACAECRLRRTKASTSYAPHPLLFHLTSSSVMRSSRHARNALGLDVPVMDIEIWGT